MLMKNATNIRKYDRLAPVYDTLLGKFFRQARMKAWQSIILSPGHRVLLVGVGTGEDFEFLPANISVTGIDISEPMLEIAKGKVCQSKVELFIMSAEALQFFDETFDCVVLNLILSVAENPQKVMLEAVRVLKNNGTILVYDKFIQAGRKPSWIRRILNIFAMLVGTDINRCYEDIAHGIPISMIKDEPAMFNGNYRIIVLKKVAG